MTPHSPVTPIAAPIDPLILEEEICSLRGNSQYSWGKQSDFEIFIAPPLSIPNILLELGRLRELSFRLVGEGSGNERDLDRFDEHYLHLFLWDTVKKQIVGSYRMGRTDLILAEFGREGLYTSILFDFEQPFLDDLNPALEMGRSFVAPDFQKNINSLLGLWKGIFSYIAQYPQYSRLFGPVSISNDYTSLSQDFMVQFLRKNRWNDKLSQHIKPTNPYLSVSSAEEISPNFESMEQVSARIADVEPDGKGIPVLLKQYLKLNATILEFNVDQDFQNCLDALILVDTRTAPSNMIRRYMGVQNYEQYLGEIKD